MAKSDRARDADLIWEIDDESREVEGLDADGRPIPAYAASLGLVAAPKGRRVAATLIELLVFAVLTIPLLVVVLPAVLGALEAPYPWRALYGRIDFGWILACAITPVALSIVFVIVQLVTIGRRGVSLGKAFTGLRLVNARTLEKPKFWRGAVVRYLILCASGLLPVLGPLLVVALSPLFDSARRGRGWPDLAAGTWLIDIKKGLDPYDVKRMRIARKMVATDLEDKRSELPSLATPDHPAHAPAYIPLARSRGGVLGAPSTDLDVDSDDDGDRYAAPPVVMAPRAEPAGISEAAPRTPVAPAAVPRAGAPGWTPPTLLTPEASPVPAPSVAPVAKPEPAPASAQVPAPEPAPLTPAPKSEPAPPALAAAGQGAAILALENGDHVSVDGAGVIIGRSPRAVEGLTPVQVHDPAMSVSKNHVAVIRAESGFAAVDRGSTNGSAILRAGVESPLEPGVPVALADGDTLRFGDRVAQVYIR